MSTTIERNVVEMRFDNQQFERNVRTTKSSLEDLRKSLDLKGATKSFADIEAASKKVDMSVLGKAVETVGLKFNAMYTIADQALRNITNRVMSTAENMAKALTVEPIMTGFSEYETQIGAIQTILANTKSKGSTLDDVNTALDELNTYADKTIYNFTEMTRNIGTFTAAGVDLDKSVTSIKGIANLAAVSGSTSQQASTAMYQLSQALASGKVNLMDWNSVVNAGMGGELFQNALKRTATNMGKDVDGLIKKYGSFRESLTQGEWLTADVLTETLTQLSGAYSKEELIAQGYTEQQAKDITELAQTAVDAATKVKTFTQLWDTLKESAQSGWTTTWEILVGDFEEAKEMLTNISNVVGDMISKSAEARNNLLQGWKDAGGRTMLIESLANVFKGLMDVIAPIKEAFTEIFPPITVDQLVKLTEGFKALTEKFKLSETASKNLKRTFKGVFAVFSIVKEVISSALQVIKPLFGGVTDLSGGFLEITASIGDWIVKLDETIKTSGIFKTVFGGIAKAIEVTITVVKNLVDAIKNFVIVPGMEAIGAFFERFSTRTDTIGKSVKNMADDVSGFFGGWSSAIAKIFPFFEALWNLVRRLGSGLGNVFGTLTGGLIDKLANADFGGILDFINTLSLGGIAAFIAKFVKGFSDITDSIGDMTGGIKENVLGILDSVKGTFEAYQESLKADTLKKIAVAIAILAGSILVLSLIDSDKLNGALGAITLMFADLMGSLALFSRIAGKMDGVAKALGSMIAISVAVLILSFALKTIGDIDTGSLINGLVGVAGLMLIVVKAAKALESDGKTVVKGAMQMVIMAGALKILASVCKELSELSFGRLVMGLSGVLVLMEILLQAAERMRTDGSTMVKGAGQLLILSTAILIMTGALKVIAGMHWSDFAKSLGGLVVIAVVMKKLAETLQTDGSKMIQGAGNMFVMAIAITIMASALRIMTGLSWEELSIGLTGLVGIALTLGLLAKAMRTDGKEMVQGAGQVLIMATAITIMSGAIMQMGKLSWEELVRGLIGLGAALGAIAGMARILSKNGKSVIEGAGSMLIMASAMGVMALSMRIMGGMSWESLIKGMVGLAGAFVIIGVAGKFLTPLIPTIASLAGSFALIGVGVVAIGVGLMAAGAGLTMLAAGFGALAGVGVAGATAIVSSITIIITGIISAIISLIPAIITKIGEGIIGICQVIADAAPVIGDMIKSLVLTLVDVLVECVPPIADGALKLIAGVLAALVEYTPQIVDSLFQFVIGLLRGLADNLPELIQVAFDVIMSFFSGVVDALKGIDTETLLNGIAGVGLVAGIMWALSSVAALVPGAMLGVLGVAAVIAEMAIMLAAIGALAQIPGLEWLISEGGDFLQAVGTAIGQFVGGLAGGFMAGMTSSLPEVGTYLSQFMINAMPFIMGIKMVDWSILEGVGALTAAIIALSVADFINGVAAFYGLGDGLADLGTQLSEFMINAMPFIMMAKDIDPNIMVGIKNLAGAVLALTSANLLDQLTSWLGGDASLASFGEELAAFGPSLKEFADSVKGVDPQSLLAAANAAKALGEMAAALPSSGGVVGFFTGENDIDVFGTQLLSFGESLTEYSKAVKDIDAEAIAVSVEALTALSGAAKEIDNFGGVVSWFCGDNSMDTFGQQLESFGTSLKNYSDTISDGNGINLDAINTSVEAIIALAGAAKEIDNFGGVVSWFCGDNALDTFGEQLSAFGNALSGYNKTLTENELNIDAIKNSAVAIEALAGAAGAIEDFGGVVSWFAGDNGLDTFGVHLESFGKSLAIYDESIADIDTAKLNQVSRSFDLLIDVMKDMDGTNFGSVSAFAYNLGELGNASVDKFISAFENSGQKAEKATEDLFKKIIDAIEGKDAQIKASGRLTMRNFAAGLAESGSVITSGIGAALTQAIADLHSFYQKFRDLGSYLVDGFANGIDANKYSAAAKARAMAAAAEEAAREELLVFSPSRKGYAIGNFFGIGFVNALVDSVGRAYDASADVAIAARTGLSDALGRVSDLINSDIDSQPTIRPVLDLSDVEAGANRIGGMFGINPSVGVLANVGSINSMMNRRSQNGSNADVVAAIKDLRDRVGTKSGDTYNLNGLSYTEGDDVGAAFKTIVRAARMERRT